MAKFEKLRDDSENSVWYREVAKDVFHIIKHYPNLEDGKELYELAEVDLFIMPMSIVRSALNYVGEGERTLAPGDKKHRFGEDTEWVLEALADEGRTAQLACSSGKALTKMKRLSARFNKDGPRRMAMSKAANAYGTSCYHYMLGLLDRSAHHHFAPSCEIKFNTSVAGAEQLNDAEAGLAYSDPLAYCNGVAAGLRLELMPLQRRGYAIAYIAGFRRGMDIRLNHRKPGFIPKWLTYISCMDTASGFAESKINITGENNAESSAAAT